MIEFSSTITLGDIMNCVVWGTGLFGAALSARKFAENQRIEAYTEIDGMYLQLLAIAIDKPFVLEPSEIVEKRQRLQYGAYAYAMWNFLETIADRCRTDPVLKDTWYPVFAHESGLHRAWFDDPANRLKFRNAFRRFVAEFAWTDRSAD